MTFKMRTKLLRSIAACACTMQDARPRIAGIVFRDGEIIASNGHVLVRVPVKHELSVMMPTELAIAACEASMSGSDGQVDEFGYAVADQNEVIIFADGDHVCVDVGGVTLRAVSSDLSSFPDVSKCYEKVSPSGNSMETLFDPGLMALAADVIRGAGGKSIHLAACGGRHDPLVFKSQVGVEFVIMPMAAGVS